jgi:hypothetical protein
MSLRFCLISKTSAVDQAGKINPTYDQSEGKREKMKKKRPLCLKHLGKCYASIKYHRSSSIPINFPLTSPANSSIAGFLTTDIAAAGSMIDTS